MRDFKPRKRKLDEKADEYFIYLTEYLDAYTKELREELIVFRVEY